MPVAFDIAERRLHDFRKIHVQDVRSHTHYRSILFVKLLVYQMDIATRSIPSPPQVRVLFVTVSPQEGGERLAMESLHSLAKNGPG